MKVLFVYVLEDTVSVEVPIRSWVTLHFGISYLSSVLKRSGHPTRLVVLGSDNPWRANIRLLNASIEELEPQVICFTAVASQYPLVSKLAHFLKSRWPGLYLLIGGVHATLNPAVVMEDPFDALCIGEGEYPVLELCDQLSDGSAPRGIANLWIRSGDGSIEKNPPRPFLQDLSRLPFPDRGMWSPWIADKRGTDVAVLLGRGCPHGCSYCCNHALKNVAGGKYVRMRSPENIIGEIALIHAQYPEQSNLYFEIESIAIDKTWLMHLCERLEEFNATIDNFISYDCNFRISPNTVDESLFIALKKANIVKLNIGLESGSERIRKEVLKRHYSNDDFLRVVSLARDYRFKLGVFNMIGLPGETHADYLETVRLNRLAQPEVHYTSIFFPYPGTEIYQICLREGYLSAPLDPRRERKKAALGYPGFSRRRIQMAYISFNYRVYRGRRPMLWIVSQTIAVLMRSNAALNYLLRAAARSSLILKVRDYLVFGQH